MGSFVPATSATLPVFDGVFTRVGSSDSMMRGESSFMAEMVECASVLHAATSKSLVVLDELGRGTSTCTWCAFVVPSRLPNPLPSVCHERCTFAVVEGERVKGCEGVRV